MKKDKIYEYKRAFFGNVRAMIQDCDVAIEVADARNLEGTRIKKLDKMFASKVIIAATKSDISQRHVQPSVDMMPVIEFSSRGGRGRENVMAALEAKRDAINARRKRAGKLPQREIRICVFGIPNVGKSSLINVLSKRHGAVTGFKAGVTKSVQWIKLAPGFLLYDTPGIVNLEEPMEQLALKSALDVERLADPEEVALGLISKCIASPNASLFSAYNIPKSESPDGILSSFAIRRGLLQKGGGPNIKEASKVLIREYQKGKFSI